MSSLVSSSHLIVGNNKKNLEVNRNRDQSGTKKEQTKYEYERKLNFSTKFAPPQFIDVLIMSSLCRYRVQTDFNYRIEMQVT